MGALRLRRRGLAVGYWGVPQGLSPTQILKGEVWSSNFPQTPSIKAQEFKEWGLRVCSTARRVIAQPGQGTSQVRLGHPHPALGDVS